MNETEENNSETRKAPDDNRKIIKLISQQVLHEIFVN